MSEENPTPEEKAIADAKALALKTAQDKASAANASRTGKGTRVFVGQTRGRSTQVISWEAYDESKPDTLPKSVAEFVSLEGLDDSDASEATMVDYLIKGSNEVRYTTASDPVAEFVDPTWDLDVQKRFRIVVKNYADNANVSIQDAVDLIKPGISKAQDAAKLAAKSAEAVPA
jgi:hypothetical protein